MKLTRKEMIELYNEHVEMRGDGKRPIGPKSKLTNAQLRRKLMRMEELANEFCDMP